MVPGSGRGGSGWARGEVRTEVYRGRPEADPATAPADASIGRHQLGRAVAYLVATGRIAAAIVVVARTSPVAGGFFRGVPVIAVIQTLGPEQ